MKRKLEEETSKKQNPAKLIKAITAGDIAEAKCLIAEMNIEEINIAAKDGKTALHWAAWRGIKEVCTLLIPKVTPETINAVTEYFGNTALHFAAHNGMKDVCEMLIPKMSFEAINTLDKNGQASLILAARQGMKDVCELLIPKMSPEAINAVNSNGHTALTWAVYKGMKEVCELLIPKMGTEAFNVTSIAGWTVLHLAIKGDHKEICKILIGNMHVQKIMELSNQSSNGHLIQKAIGKIVADFINDKFSSSEINPMDFTGFQIKLLKLYQIVDQDLLKPYLNEEKYISDVNNYIIKHYFRFISVCKSISEDSPISILVSSDDSMSYMLSYLASHSLCPELFATTELSGEEVVVSSES
jgi:ankyrin repeat protein